MREAGWVKENTLAISLGYKLKKRRRETADTERSSFFKGNRHVWKVREGWQTANLIDGQWRDHKKFADLEEALTRED